MTFDQLALKISLGQNADLLRGPNNAHETIEHLSKALGVPYSHPCSRIPSQPSYSSHTTYMQLKVSLTPHPFSRTPSRPSHNSHTAHIQLKVSLTPYHAAAPNHMLTHTSPPCSCIPPSTHPWPSHTIIQPHARPHGPPCNHTSSQLTHIVHTTHHATVAPSHALTKPTQLTKLPL